MYYSEDNKDDKRAAGYSAIDSPLLENKGTGYDDKPNNQTYKFKKDMSKYGSFSRTAEKSPLET